jgi:bacterial/archaeal transporter family-2 protein
MQTLILTVVIAVIGGVAASLQAPVVGIINQRLGTLESVFLTYFGGGMLALVLLLLLGGGNWGAWRTLPWYALLGGPLGLVVIGTLSYTVPRLGVVTTFILFIAAQLIIGAWLDHFGLLGVPVHSLDLSRLSGILVLLIGAWLMLR